MTSAKEVQTARPYETLIKDLAGIAKLDTENGGNFEIASKAVDGIMTATNLDELFAANDAGPDSLKDNPIIGTPVMINDVMWRKSAEQYRKNGESLGVYGVMELVTDKGEVHTVSTGATNVVASVRWLQLHSFVGDGKTRVVFRAKVTENGALLTVGKPA